MKRLFGRDNEKTFMIYRV